MNTNNLYDALNEAEQRRQEANDKFASARIQVRDMQDAIDKMKQDANTKPALLAKALAELSALKELLPAHEAQAERALAHRQSIHLQIERARQRIEHRKADLYGAKADLASKEHRIAELQAQMRNVETFAGLARDQVRAIEAEIAGLRSSLGEG